MRVLLFDPWGAGNTAEYLNGLIYGLSELVDLTVYTNYYFVQYVYSKATINKIFFKRSQKMKRGCERTVVRGLEYVNGYRIVLDALKTKHYDIVHINWLLCYKIDIFYLKQIKKHCNKIVYNAHNALPHVNGNKYFNDLRKVYELVDVITVHGTAIKNELIRIFPETISKVFVSMHGCVLKKPDNGLLDSLGTEKIDLLKKSDRVLLCCGNIFRNKGFDRLLKIWLNNFKNTSAVLVIGGKVSEQYAEYSELKKRLANINNVILLDGFISDSLLNALFNFCSIVVLPYRHASMSGVIFTAAQYSKPVICTDVGALSEYLEPDSDSIVCENTDQALSLAMIKVMSMNLGELRDMGVMLHKHITYKCDWKRICSLIANSIYRDVPLSK